MRGNHSCFSNCVYADCAQGVAEMPRLALRSGMNKAINDDPRIAELKVDEMEHPMTPVRLAVPCPDIGEPVKLSK